jgi:hypothetical protein
MTAGAVGHSTDARVAGRGATMMTSQLWTVRCAHLMFAVCLALSATLSACGDDDDSDDTAAQTGGQTTGTGTDGGDDDDDDSSGTTGTGTTDSGDDDDDDSTGTTGDATDTTDTGDTGGSDGGDDVSKSIGPAGGTITLDGASLTVPAGALTSTVTLRVTKAAPGTPLPAAGGTALGDYYRFTPHGTLFTKPVTIRIALNASADAVKIARTANEISTTWDLLDATIENGFAVAQTTSFSFDIPLLVSTACTPSCTGEQCGPGTDPTCPYVCGVCQPNERCQENLCIAGTCEGSCDGKTCGQDNGCGDPCTACEGNKECRQPVGGGALQCFDPCVPQCDGKSCGSDGCGGVCGACENPPKPTCNGTTGLNQSVNANCNNGACEYPLTVIQCGSGKVCQTQGDGSGACVTSGGSCTANCTGKTCGDDGCGGLCGTCTEGQWCNYTSTSAACATGPHCPDADVGMQAGAIWGQYRGCMTRQGLSSYAAPANAPTVKWQKTIGKGGTYTNPENQQVEPIPARNEIAIDKDGHIYVQNEAGDVYSFTGDGANQRWTINIDGGLASGSGGLLAQRVPSIALLETEVGAENVGYRADTKTHVYWGLGYSSPEPVRTIGISTQTFTGPGAYGSPLVDETGAVFIRTPTGIAKLASGATTVAGYDMLSGAKSGPGSLATTKGASTPLVYGTNEKLVTTEGYVYGWAKTSAQTSGVTSLWTWGITPAGTFNFPTGTNADVTPAIWDNKVVFMDAFQSAGGTLRIANLADGTPSFALGTEPYADCVRPTSVAVTRDGRIYVACKANFTGANSFVAFDGAAFKTLWKYSTGAASQGEPTVDAQGSILFGDETGTLYSLSRSGKLRWQVKVCDKPIRTAPTIGKGGLLYVNCDDQKIYGLGTP